MDSIKSPEEQMLENKVWAVIGASNNPDKYGHWTYKKLRSKGYTVYPVNPGEENICDDTCFSNVSSLPQKPDVLNIVVPAAAGMEIVEEAAALGIKNIWLQPGTYDQKLLDFIKSKGLNCVQNCVLVALR